MCVCGRARAWHIWTRSRTNWCFFTWEMYLDKNFTGGVIFDAIQVRSLQLFRDGDICWSLRVHATFCNIYQIWRLQQCRKRTNDFYFSANFHFILLKQCVFFKYKDYIKYVQVFGYCVLYSGEITDEFRCCRQNQWHWLYHRLLKANIFLQCMS